MKIYVVVGAKKNGKTDKITQQFIQGAQSAGHEVETEYLFTKKNTHGCIDCQSCKRNGGTCVWTDDITPMLERFLNRTFWSLLLLFTSSAYLLSLNSSWTEPMR